MARPDPIPPVVHPQGAPRSPGLLAGMRIRKKLMLLHSFFSLVLATILAIALQPAVTNIVQQAELQQARLVQEWLSTRLRSASSIEPLLAHLQRGLPEDVTLTSATQDDFPNDPEAPALAQKTPGGPIILTQGASPPRVVVYDGDSRRLFVATVRLDGARQAVVWLYVFLVVALLGVYALIALALEVFVLPRHVYSPIRAMLRADEAVRQNRRTDELIPDKSIPADELGQIMRSRNDSVRAMRENESRLNDALAEIERVAADLQKKNLLIEAAQRNLADADRLASLGILSAGLAHELNTPLAVIKGLVERIAHSSEGRLNPDEAALLLRVVGRLERLSESLLDFARVRPPSTRPTEIRPLIEEAWTLVRLDREARRVELHNGVPDGFVVPCDGDRVMQVFVNLLRNAVDATLAAGREEGRIEVSVGTHSRADGQWASITFCDSGRGIAPEILGRLFEPFASTRLDSRGTGLGLAVSQGIIREHAGALVARNRPGPNKGAEFEVLLPLTVSTHPAQPVNA